MKADHYLNDPVDGDGELKSTLIWKCSVSDLSVTSTRLYCDYHHRLKSYSLNTVLDFVTVLLIFLLQMDFT